ncbi:MAG: serine/threonine protein kinase, partial [Pseudorhodobacter sp.]|nr:serine/threonine protein kinase [Rhizobacter sp.]
MTTPATHWAHIKALFEAVVELPAAKRETAISAADLDAPSAVELRSLLAHHDQASSGFEFMARSAASQMSEPAADDVLESSVLIGQRLGAWQIVRPVGSGGMGEVFEARRADGQFEGRAAVKLLKRGMDSAAVLRRFAQERQALARLSHPHIASLFDAGASDQGLPYFVLEFVDGQPIDAAVRGMPLEARLRLFLQLADAVAYAHRNLLVHRDLKPGNVLVNTEGQVKLLDFGIAKALDPLDGHEGNTTVGGQRPYTPNYASPEQVRGEPVSTATDVYSLGVLLYQMLTGTRPTGRNASTPAEAARCVLVDEPTKPSRLTADEAVDPQWFSTRKKLEGDLDNILLKALEKTTERRYTSVDALAADVLAFMQGHPVSAHAASPGYVAAKFVRRHRVAVLASVLGSVGLVLGLAASLVQGRWLGALGVAGLAAGLALALLQARRAALARDTAQRHATELRLVCREVVVEFGDAITHVPGGQRRQAELLATSVGYLERMLPGSSEEVALRQELVAELGAMHARLAHLRSSGEFNAREDAVAVVQHVARARVLLCEAERGAALPPAAWKWWALALGDLARHAQVHQQLHEALAHLEESDQVLQRGLRQHPGHATLQRVRGDMVVLAVQVHYGWDRPDLGQPEQALLLLDSARAHYEPLLRAGVEAAERAEAVFQTGTVVSTRALLLARLKQFSAAAEAAREAISWREQATALQPHHRGYQGGLAADRNLRAGLCLDLGDAVGALQASTPGWAALQRLIAEDPGHDAWREQQRWLSFHHGRALLGTGRAEEACEVLQLSADWLSALQAEG